MVETYNIEKRERQKPKKYFRMTKTKITYIYRD